MEQAIIEIGPHIVHYRGVDGFWQGIVETDQVPHSVVLSLLGRIEQKNGQFEVRTEAGSSLIPASRVLKLCDTPQDAYAFLKQRVNRKDPLDSLRLARWCVKFGLTEAAHQEAEETLKLQPGNLEAQRIARADATPSSGDATAAKPHAITTAAAEHSYSPETLRSRGLVAKRGLVKILGRGELEIALTVKAHAFSNAARAAIEQAGGTCEVLAAPWGDGRPAARGNALTNR